MSVPVRRVDWVPCWRLIPAKYAEKRVLGKVADKRDLAAVEELEQMTNQRLREARVSGSGNEYIMAPFSYRNASRFSDGSYGVFYAAKALPTAVEETKHHRQIFMRATNEPPMRLELRALTATLGASLHDLRGRQQQHPQVYSRTSYSASQAFAKELYNSSNGIVYDSVRHAGGQCAGVFNPAVLGDCRPERGIIFEWDGKKIDMVYELSEVE